MNFKGLEIEEKGRYTWEIPARGDMNAPGVVYASREMMREILSEDSLQQVINVAHLPGIERYSIAMPDIHLGYGFPIGGVAAMDMDRGVISPGGVGYDINCGCRLLRSDLTKEDISPHLDNLGQSLFRNIPSGVGSTGKINLAEDEQRRVLKEGSLWAVREGFGVEEDIDRTEDGGTYPGADPEMISKAAFKRGKKQLGTLGSGNHFLEVDLVDEIFNSDAAQAFGLGKGQVVVLIHTGSRGLGYQVCDDYLGVMRRYMVENRINLPDRQLACAHIRSREGKSYLQALACAANYAWANRQILSYWVRETFQKVLRMGPRHLNMGLVYDCGHNTAKVEVHEVGGEMKELLVHRKGSTRAFPPGRKELPRAYREIGQPVLIPGDMGRYSYVLVGDSASMSLAFGSTCHGAGRLLSRTKAKKSARGRNIERELRSRGIRVYASGRATLLEEVPWAYKDVSEVVEVVDKLGIARKVAKLIPILVVKG